MGKNRSPLVAICMGSQSDLKIMMRASEILNQFRIPHKIHILSAHRTPKKMADFAEMASQNGYQVLIAGAGGAAHLPGMMAATSELPVIGVPILATKGFDGMDALLSIAQMPEGVPVATMAVNGAGNAALLAVQILARTDLNLQKNFRAHKRSMIKKVQTQNRQLRGLNKKR